MHDYYCNHSNLCNTFNVPKGEKIKHKAYLKWTLKAHPDKGGNTKRFQEVSSCYNENKHKLRDLRC